MKFTNLEIESKYDSKKNDIFDEFIIPLLSNSHEYRRIGRYFSLQEFQKLGNGLNEFVENNGRIKLILFLNLTQDDANIINQNNKNIEEVLLEQWNSNFIQQLQGKDDKLMSNFGALIKNGFLEIKIVKIFNNEGKFVSSKELESIENFNSEIGIFFGKESNEIITFKGKIELDEKEDQNYIIVSKYWNEDEKESAELDYSVFKKFWSGEEFDYIENFKFQAVDLPLVIKEKICNLSNQESNKITFERMFSLRKIQKQAIDEWRNNQFLGIYEMATGTGKTRTAIGSIKELEKMERFFSVIVVPSNPLAYQWKEELEKWGYYVKMTIGTTNWKAEMKDVLRLFNIGKIKNLCIITSYITYAKKEFFDIIYSQKIKKLLIADEVHHAGSEYSQNGLIENYNFKLGLTATLERYFDESGTNTILDYFGGIVFTYTMDQAIKDGYLSNYNYHIRQVDLTDDEYLKYKEETIIMARNYSRIYNDSDAFEKYKRAAERRANIIKSAFNKFEELNKIISEGYKINYGLIYCNHDQIDTVQSILNKIKPVPIFSRQITEKKTPQRKEREEVFNGLVSGLYDVILAINILDEGWDCPQVKNCILMANSGNEKQYIQRRGRILRTFNKTYSDGTKKTISNIFDMCVIPELDYDDDEVKLMEIRLIEKELNRMQIMANSASNKESQEFLKRYRSIIDQRKS